MNSLETEPNLNLDLLRIDLSVKILENLDVDVDVRYPDPTDSKRALQVVDWLIKWEQTRPLDREPKDYTKFERSELVANTKSLDLLPEFRTRIQDFLGVDPNAED